METLTGKDLKYYLGTGLRIDGYQSKLNCNILQCFIDGDWDVVPLMLPLSALIEPLPDGSIPIVELAKMSGFYNLNLITGYCNGEYFVRQSGSDKRFIYANDAFFINRKGVAYQLQLFEYLYANHFWLGDQSLFETSEIIDKRTLN